VHHSGMNAYSEDLLKKIVEAKERGMSTVEVARTFAVGLSSVKRYAKVAR
jgi:transposase